MQVGKLQTALTTALDEADLLRSQALMASAECSVATSHPLKELTEADRHAASLCPPAFSTCWLS